MSANKRRAPSVSPRGVHLMDELNSKRPPQAYGSTPAPVANAFPSKTQMRMRHRPWYRRAYRDCAIQGDSMWQITLFHPVSRVPCVATRQCSVSYVGRETPCTMQGTTCIVEIRLPSAITASDRTSSSTCPSLVCLSVDEGNHGRKVWLRGLERSSHSLHRQSRHLDITLRA